jgi:two-component sensor histidine kinase
MTSDRGGRGARVPLPRPLYLPICLAALAFLAGCSAPSPRAPQSYGGVLDLRGYDFDRGESAPLTGQWDFLPGSVDISYEDFMRSPRTLRKVPDLWKGDEAGGLRGHGSGSYHLTVLLPAHSPPLALHYLSASTAFRIEVQGKPLVQIGEPSSDPKTARAAYRPGFVRIGEAQGRIDIMVRVSNYVYRSGGLWFPIFLGPADEIESIHMGELAAALAQVTAIAIMGLILLLLFSLRRKEKAFLFSGLFALVMALRVSVTGEYILCDFWPWIPFSLLIKLEYLTVSLSFASATAFFTSAFPRLLDPRLKWACIIPSLAYALMTLALPLDPLTRSLAAYQAFALVNIAVGMGALVIQTFRKPDIEMIALSIGGVLLAASAVNDILYSSFVWWTGNLAPWGVAVFVGFQVVVLARRLIIDFGEAEELLDHKELLIKEIHHRVKNNLQVVASLVTLQSSRVSDPEIKAGFTALRLRIISMSLVHEKLYGKAATESLDLGSYVQDLIKLLISKDKMGAEAVNLTIKSQPIDLGVDTCVNVGLIVTELVSNSLKHALLPKGGGELKVAIAREGKSVRILIEDDGPGFPPDFDPKAKGTLGYRIVTTLLKNAGQLEFLPGPGGRVSIRLNGI